MKLSAITLISSGEKLKYPYKECIANLCEQVDEVILNVDLNSDDETIEEVEKLYHQYNNLFLIFTTWNFKNTGNGSELAKQANICLEQVTGDWIIYLQADEFLHEKDIEPIRDLLSGLERAYSQIELWRTYFWKDLQTRDFSKELYLGRIFKKGTHQVGGDGMFLIRKEGEVWRTNYPIFHYSRMGTEEEITQRVRQLDKMFHEKEIVDSFKNFSYNEIVKEIKYKGPHPKRIKEYYNGI
jgi:glycosyltransferase involved in cell wall biosynthesis